MLVKFKSNLGSIDCAAINKQFGTDVDYKKCVAGESVDLPEAFASALREKHRAIFETVEPQAKKQKPDDAK